MGGFPKYSLEENRKRFKAFGSDGNVIREGDQVKNAEGKVGTVVAILGGDITRGEDPGDAHLRVEIVVGEPADKWRKVSGPKDS